MLRYIRMLRLTHVLNIVFLFLSTKIAFFHRFLRVRPIFATVKLTERCNSKCITCNTRGCIEDGLDTGEVNKLVEQLWRIGCRFIRFTGGEALLRSDIEAIVHNAKKTGFRHVTLATNGLLLERKSESLSEVDRITVSLDGMGELNDKIRGIQGDFDKALKGIRKMQSENGGTDVEVASTIVAINTDDIPRLIEMCQELGIMWFPNLLDGNVYFFAEPDLDGLDPQKLQREEIEKLVDRIEDAKRRHPKTMLINKRQIAHIRKHLTTGEYPKYCVLGYTNIGVSSNGAVYSGCWALRSLGNVQTTSIAEIVNSDAYSKRAKVMLNRECPQCTCGWAINAAFE